MASNLEKRVEALEKLVKELQCKDAIKISKKLGKGDTFELNGLTWTILDITEKGYLCLASRLEESMQFDSADNDWKTSDLREYLNGEFYEELAGAVGVDNIIPFERNLLSLDGQTEYGICEDKVSLLNVDEYRQHRALIPNADYWWWTITPDSTKCNGDTTYIRVVSGSGVICLGNYFSVDGVRPVCIFSSAIFESEE